MARLFPESLPEMMVDALAIRDDTAHTPGTDASCYFIDMRGFDRFTVTVINTLDQAVTLTIQSNDTATTTNATPYGTTITAIAATGIESRTYGLPAAGLSAWIYPSIIAGGVPTSGAVTVRITKFQAGV